MSTNIIKIKRSNTTNTPATLADGELAFSNLSEILFIGGSGEVKEIGGAGAFIRKDGDVLKGDLVIDGNLTVKGTTTSVNSNEVNIGDAIIQLNSDIAADVAPTENAGFEVKRGSALSAFFVWDEAGDYFTAHVGTGENKSAASFRDLQDVHIRGSFSGYDLAIDERADIGGALAVGGSANIVGTVTVGNTLTANKNLIVKAGASITGNVTVAGGTFTTRGFRDIATTRQLDIDNARTQVGNDLQVLGSATVNEAATFKSAATFENSLTVKGISNLGALVIEGGTLRADGTGATTVTIPHVTVAGGAINGTTIGAGTASTGRFTALTATGAFNSRGITDSATAKRLTITNDLITVANALRVAGAATFENTVTIVKDLSLTASALIGSNLTVNKLATLRGNVTLGANLTGAGASTSAIDGFTIDGGTF